MTGLRPPPELPVLDRRQFLAAVLMPRADAPPEPAHPRRHGAYLTPGYRAMRLAAVPEAHGVWIHAVPAEAAQPAGTLAVNLYRYDRAPQTVRRLVLPWARICCGLYLRSSIPYAVRHDLRPGDYLRFTAVLAEPSPIAVYQECHPDQLGLIQVVIAVGRLQMRER
jgi:hypothetical protein